MYFEPRPDSLLIMVCRQGDTVKRHLRGLEEKVYSSAIENSQQVDKLPDKLMITIHPERWTDERFLWSKQAVFQNIKDAVKRVLMGRRQ